MKSLLGRLSRRRAVGVYINNEDIAISQVAATIFGPVEIAQYREKYQPDELPDVLRRTVQPLMGKRRSRRRTIAFGMPLLRVFYSTRPLKATNLDVSPKVLLHEVLRSPNSNVDDMAFDMKQTSFGKRPVVSLLCCRKKYLAGLVDSIEVCGLRPVRVEPAPFALLRAAEQQYRAPRRAKTVVRFFLGDGEGLAVLCSSGWPVVPRSFKFTDADLTTALVSTVRAIDAVGKLCGSDAAIDAASIHGGAGLRNQVDREALEKQVGAPIQWHDGPALDDRCVALGVAIGCLKPNAEAFDLSQSIKTPETIWELFPWGDIVLQIVAIVCLGLFLLNHCRNLDTRYAAVRSETDGRQWMSSRTEQDLTKEKRERSQRVDAMRKFLATRVLWTSYTQDLPLQLPLNATLNSFQGICELEKKGTKNAQGAKPKKSLVMRIGAPISQDGSAPREIDDFLDSLRGHPLLKRDFPLVELADIKWYQPYVAAKPTAYFTVVCLPKQSNARAGADVEKAEK